MKCDQLDVEAADVNISLHAVQQAQRRLPEFRGQNYQLIGATIQQRVMEACAKGTVFDVKPKPFRGKGEGPTALPPGQRLVVWRDSAYVIDIGMLPKVTVVTSYMKLREC